MKFFLMLLALTFLISTRSAAQKVLKKNIPIVRSNYSQSAKDFLQNLANRIRRNGYRYAADYLEKITAGGFGSGFIYTDPSSNKAYIITNRHVVSQALSANLEFIHLDKEVKFENCKILAIDESLDLALIELPENHEYNIGSGLQIINEIKEEGTDVFSAGFPGLAGKPSWQLGKGIISNSSVQNDIFVGTDKIGAIQHTAPIDPGSSGGPLMIKNGDTYNIIGVNTWGIINRENAYFAISTKAVKEFLSKYLGKTFNSETDLEHRVKRMFEILKEDYTKASPYVSDEYVANMSTNNFFEVVINVPDSVEKKMKKRFSSGHPIDAVRVGLTYFLYKQQSKGEVKFVRIDSTDHPNEKKVVLSSQDKEFDTFWIYDLGEWRLKNYTKLKLKNLEDNGIAENLNLDKLIKLGYITGTNADNATISGFTLEYIRFRNPYYSLGWELSYTNLEYEESLGGEVSTESPSLFQLGYHFGGHLPIKLSNIYLIPNATVNGGMVTGEDMVGFYYSWGGGLNTAYKINHSLSLILGASYKRLHLPEGFSPFNTLQLHIGIAY